VDAVLADAKMVAEQERKTAKTLIELGLRYPVAEREQRRRFY
jgi:hypothetical protein